MASVGCLYLAYSLQADVVAATFQNGPFEVLAEVLGKERQVLRSQLVLQRLRCGGNHDSLVRENRGNQVAHRLAGPGSRSHHQVAAGGEGVVNGDRHVTLTDTVFGRWKRTGHGGDRNANGFSRHSERRYSGCSVQQRQRRVEFVFVEIGPCCVGEVHLAPRDLPEQEVGDTHFTRCPHYDINRWEIG